MKLPNDPGVCLGIFAPIVAFSFIAAAILTHPWFSFQHNALSDLGNPDVEMNWIFSSGLVIAGILGFLFALDLIGRLNGAERIGAIIFAGAMIFLAMIGVFPEGSALHFPVSASFYLLSAIVIIIFALVWMTIDEQRIYGIIAIILVAVGFAIALIPKWDGIAIPETAGAVIIFIWVYMVIWQTYPSITG